MKIQQILLLAGASFLTQSVFADVTLNDACSNLSGSWQGTGTAKAGDLVCDYSGVIQVMPDSTPGTYLAVTNLNLVKGGFCPPSVELKMSGTCKDQNLVLQNSAATLAGKVGIDGKTADLTGHIIFNVIIQEVDASLENVHLVKMDS